MWKRYRTGWPLVWVLPLALWSQPAVHAQSAGPDYTNKVAPLLKKYCGGCHNSEDREGKLSLETFAELQRGGDSGPALLPGQSQSSRLVRVLTGQSKLRMPPEGNVAPSSEEIEILRAWVDSGARGPEGAEPDRRTLITPWIQPTTSNQNPITAIAVAPQADLIAVAQFGGVELQSMDGTTVHKLAGLPGKVNAVHFSSDASRLITASGVAGLYGVATIWNVHDGSRIRDFTAHRDILYDAELSPDGQQLATCSYDRQVIIWNVETAQQLHALEGHNDAIYDIAFSPDGEVLATASGDETVKLWRLDSGMRLDTLSQPQAEQYVVTFSPDGRYVLAGGADNRIRVWQFVSKTKRRINPLVFARFAHEGAVIGLAFSGPGDSLVSLAEDNTVKLWETRQFSELHLYAPENGQVTDLAFLASGDGFMVARADGATERYPLVAHHDTPASPPIAAAAPATSLSEAPNRVAEHEPNNVPREAMDIFLPARIQGVVAPTDDRQRQDVDLFRFASQAGQQWVIEVNAARNKSLLDSKIDVLDSDGGAIPRVLLQAVRDSYFTFRGANSEVSDGLRLHNWEEMELNEYLYANGEIIKLWHYPRGPDSGFQVYPGRGNRWTFFDTTPISHALHEPCYIVHPHPPGTQFISNGLPVFTVYYENDDDSLRRWGADSRLTFRAPADGRYLLRLADSRGLGGAEYKYELTVRPIKPDFKLTIGGGDPIVHAGSGQEFSLTLERLDGFEGEVRVDVTGLPPGFRCSTPLVIEAGQETAVGAIYARPDARQPAQETAKSSRFLATAVINGQEVTREVGSFGEIKLSEKPKLLVQLRSVDDTSQTPPQFDQPLELVIAPGETITAKVRIERNGFKERVRFGNADSGRNLPHGVYVDNIGLNGLLIVEGQSERTFFITAAKWVPETTRMFHLRAQDEGNQTSWPLILHVRQPQAVAQVPR